jgi:hypothetical protein
VSFLLHLATLCLSPEFRFTHDRREADGERYTSVCAGLYQRPTTWECLEIPAPARKSTRRAEGISVHGMPAKHEPFVSFAWENCASFAGYARGLSGRGTFSTGARA